MEVLAESYAVHNVATKRKAMEISDDEQEPVKQEPVEEEMFED